MAFRDAARARASGAPRGAARHSGMPADGASFADPGWMAEESVAAGILSSILTAPTEYSLFCTDSSGVIRLWSRGSAALYGYEAPAVLGKFTWWDLCPPGEEPGGGPGGDGAGGLRPPLDVALRRGGWRGTVKRMRRRGGECFPAYVVITPLRSQTGAHSGFLTISMDISRELGRLEEAEDARLAVDALFETDIVPLVAADPLGRITHVSASIEPFTGRRREELVGTHITEYTTEVERARELIKEVLREGRASGREFVMRRPDGRTASVLVNASRMDGRGGKIQGLLGVFIDLSEQRRLREDLRRSESYYRTLIEAAPDGLAVVGTDGAITDVNQQMSALTGYGRDELIGCSFTDCFADTKGAGRLVRLARSGEAVHDLELPLVARDESRKRVSVSVTAPAEEGWIVASVRDVTGQAVLRDRLAEERAYNRSIIDSSANGLAICDLRHVITDVNPTICRMTGRSREALIGAGMRECFAEPDTATDVINRALLHGPVTNAELALAGKALPVLVNVSLLHNGGGMDAGLLVSVRDVSEQARLRQQLDVQDAYARARLEAYPSALFTISADGVISDANTAASVFTGYARQRLLGRRFASLFADPAEAAAAVAAAFSDGQVADAKLILAPMGRPPVTVSFRAGEFTDPGDGQSALVGSLRDITDEQQTREQLHVYTQSLYGATNDALVITDPLGIITDVNHQMELLTGRRRDDLVGSNVEECFTDPARGHDFVASVLREGRVSDFELTVQPPGGDAVVLWYNAATFAGSDGKLEGIFASARDITERKRFEELQASMLERARDLDRAKSEFVSRISHELRSPLTSVLGYLELLSSGDPGPLNAEQQRMTEVIYRNGRRLLALIEDLLLLSRIESGALTLLYEPVRLGPLIAAVHESFLPAIRRGQLASDVDTDPELELEGDPAQLERVVANLLSNAVKFTPPGGQISVRCWREHGRAFLSVSDTGIGVPEDEQEQMFNRFFRSSISAERETQGSGLGLYIVKQVVEAHRGTVTVASAPGEGSTFTVTMPIRRPPPGKAGGGGNR